eukprot:867577-Pyramimonas_sp.AAC.1
MRGRPCERDPGGVQRKALCTHRSGGVLSTTCECNVGSILDWAALARGVRFHAKAATSPRRQADQQLAATIA